MVYLLYSTFKAHLLKQFLKNGVLVVLQTFKAHFLIDNDSCFIYLRNMTPMCFYFNKKQVVTCINTNYRSTVISLMTFVRQFVANFTEPCSHPVPPASSLITDDLSSVQYFTLFLGNKSLAICQ